MGIILTHSLTGIIRKPCCSVIVGEIKQIRNSLLTANEVKQCATCIGGYVLIQVIDIICHLYDTGSLIHDCAIEVAVGQNRVNQVVGSSSGDTYAHVIEIIEVFLKVFLGEVIWNVADIVKNGFPINISKFR